MHGWVYRYKTCGLSLQKTVKENCFSKHDNRHAFQNSGVYFGQVLQPLIHYGIMVAVYICCLSPLFPVCDVYRV